MNIQDTINSIGDKIPEWTQFILDKISDSGFVANDLSARIVSIGVIVLIAWGVLHFAQGLKPLLIWVIKILSIILVASILFATFVL